MATQVPAQYLHTGHIVQVVHSESGAAFTGSGVYPEDDTIPQISGGNEFITATITPKFSTDTLLISANIWCTLTTAQMVTVALFQDSISNALATTRTYCGGNDFQVSIPLVHSMTAPSTSPIVFRIRIGAPSATIAVNGYNGTRQAGGTGCSGLSIMEISS